MIVSVGMVEVIIFDFIMIFVKWVDLVFYDVKEVGWNWVYFYNGDNGLFVIFLNSFLVNDFDVLVELFFVCDDLCEKLIEVIWK